MAGSIERWFSVLDLPTDAPRSAVDVAYRQLVQVWHPDRFAHNRTLQLKAEVKLKEINEAYDGLSAAWPTIRPEHQAEPLRSTSRPGAGLGGIVIACSGCGRQVRVSTSFSRTVRARCPHCGTIVEISIQQEPKSGAQTSVTAETAGAGSRTASSKSVKRAVWLVLAAVAVLIFANLPSDDDPLRVVSFTPLDQVTSSVSGAAPAPVLPSCATEPATRPASGAELSRQYRGGRGRLTVSNGTGSDAVAVLSDDVTGDPRRAIYIRNGEVGLVTSIPLGAYRLRFQFGERWLARREFCYLSGTSEFAEAFEFTQAVSEGGITYATYSVTLHETSDGNARTTRLPNLPLGLPPQ